MWYFGVAVFVGLIIFVVAHVVNWILSFFISGDGGPYEM